jgi:hypothetical protein
MKHSRHVFTCKGGLGTMTGCFRVFVAASLVLGSTSLAVARGKTGVIEKKKIDDQKVEIFTDTVYGYTLTTPANWDFKVQKEKSNEEYNPFRLRAQNKDKQIPTQLWDSPSAVVNAHIHLFVFDLDESPEAIRDSLASPTAGGDWQNPIAKNCELLRAGTFLNKMDIRWEKWKGSAFSVEQTYTAQIPTGGGLFGSVAEKRLAEFYVFPFRQHKMVIYMVTEREFLEENRKVVQELLEQIDPEEG